MIDLSNSFLKWAFEGRRQLLFDIDQGKVDDENSMFIEFTRHTPVMITNGPSGLNGSVKGFGFVPLKDHLKETTRCLLDVIEKGEQASDKERLKALIEIVYSDTAAKKLDFSKFVSLELAKKHTWDNVISGNNCCTLVYYQPPMISFEVRGRVEIHQDDDFSLFANAVHDIYHSKNTNVANKPAYIFNIEEIFDNSVRGFGKKIY